MTTPAFCRRCGAAVRRTVPQGDHREREVCPRCGNIHYDNPLPVVGCLLEHEGRVLLCRRAIEPRRGFWTLPAGFMEQGETLLEGALREAREEADAVGEDMRLFALYSLPRISQVYVMFRGTLRDGHARAAEETLEARLFLPGEIPDDEIAFPVITDSLRRWRDPQEGGPLVALADVFSPPGAPPEIVRHPVSPTR